ncbi:hypothetical protein F2Q70_00034779 [Brassica cretica]|uniref:Defensin-like protein n=1 Tax=Brassica cretica TaxID=69181 RepID=A0A8S9JT67_BRACR|nr:hypothetical protein F2Q70_00034779 [Brassica cretica]
MIPQQWTPPCGSQCTHKYAALTQIPCMFISLDSIDVDSIRNGSLRFIFFGSFVLVLDDKNRSSATLCSSWFQCSLFINPNLLSASLATSLNIDHLLACFLANTVNCRIWHISLPNIRRVFCKKGCDADSDSWEDCVSDCSEICYKDPVLKDRQWSAYIDRSPGAASYSEECFHACVAGCGYKFEVGSEEVDKVKPKRPPPPPPKPQPPPRAKGPKQPPSEEVPGTSA